MRTGEFEGMVKRHFTADCRQSEEQVTLSEEENE
jgi:hypothetical protein